MKILTLISSIMIVGCSASQDITIDKILRSNEFSIEVHTQGCFGGSDMSFKILKERNERFMEYPVSLAGDSNKVMRINLTPEKEKILREFMIEGVKEKREGICTSRSTYKVGNFGNNILFKDQSCRINDYLKQLIK